MSAEIKFSLSLGLVILYGLGVVIWYELLRSQLLELIGRRRRRRRRQREREDQPVPVPVPVAVAVDGDGVERAGPAASEPERPAVQAADASAQDPARTHYYLARDAAEAERDAAVEAATAATRQAIERIERRYGQTAAAAGDPAGGTARAERDAAVEAANAAIRQAVGRIERRYGEIVWALEDEETERLEALQRL